MKLRPITDLPEAPCAVLFFSRDLTFYRDGADVPSSDVIAPPRDERWGLGFWDGHEWCDNGTGHTTMEEWHDPRNLPTHWFPLPAQPELP